MENDQDMPREDGKRKRVRFTNFDCIQTFGSRSDVTGQPVTKKKSTSASNNDDPRTSEYKFLRKLIDRTVGDTSANKNRSENVLMESDQDMPREDRRKRVRFTNLDTIHTFGSRSDVTSQPVTKVKLISASNNGEPKTSEYKSLRKLIEETVGGTPAKEKQSENILMENDQDMSREEDMVMKIFGAEPRSSPQKLPANVKSQGPLIDFTPANSLMVSASSTLKKPFLAESSNGDYFKETRYRLLKVAAKTWSLEVDDLISNGSRLIPKLMQRLGFDSKKQSHQLDHDLSRNSEACVVNRLSPSSCSKFLQEQNLVREDCELMSTNKNMQNLASKICYSEPHMFLSPLHKNKEKCNLLPWHSQELDREDMDFSMDFRRDLLTDIGSTYRPGSCLDSPWILCLPAYSSDLNSSDTWNESGPHKNREKQLAQMLCCRKGLQFLSPLHENKERCNGLLPWDSPGADARYKEDVDYSSGSRGHLIADAQSSYRVNLSGGYSPCDTHSPIYSSDFNVPKGVYETVPLRSYLDHAAPFQISTPCISLEPSFDISDLNYVRFDGFHSSDRESYTHLPEPVHDEDFFSDRNGRNLLLTYHGQHRINDFESGRSFEADCRLFHENHTSFRATTVPCTTNKLEGFGYSESERPFGTDCRVVAHANQTSFGPTNAPRATDFLLKWERLSPGSFEEQTFSPVPSLLYEGGHTGKTKMQFL